jgi:hypothetical protein
MEPYVAMNGAVQCWLLSYRTRGEWAHRTTEGTWEWAREGSAKAHAAESDCAGRRLRR